MSDQLAGELLINLSVAAARYPGHRGDTRLSPATLTRWILRGARSVDGRTVHLAALRCGHRWLTSHEAMSRFMEALRAEVQEQTPARTPAQRDRAAERASRELERMGA